jgi:propane monooxygenase reductase subunit
MLELPGKDITRSYSMAGSPRNADRLHFMIKRIPGGKFSTQMDQLRPGDRLTVHGPHGSFWIRDHGRPIILVGGGAGMAPLWSMLLDLAEKADPREIDFFYGARTYADLFHLTEIEELRTRLPGLRFFPALSHELGGAPDRVALGLVTDLVDERLGKRVKDYDAYLCGPPAMIDAALELLTDYGLEERRSLFYDKFTAS